MKGERDVGGVRCGEVLADLSAYLDGELDAARVAVLQGHVGGCDTCARFGGRFAEAVQALRGAPAEAACPPEVSDRLKRALGL